MDSQQFLEELRGMVAAKHSKDHHIFDLIQEGELTWEQLQGFSKQFYLLFPKPFPKPIAAMLSRCPPDDPELERMWLGNLLDEATGGETGTVGHRGMYVKFAEAMGIPHDELEAVKPLPETAAFLHWRELLINQRSWLELFAAQGLCLEGTASPRMHRVVDGLVNHYGFSKDDERLEYWVEHMTADVEHMKVGPYAVLRYAVNDDAQQRVRQAVQETLDVFWLVFDGMIRAFVDQDPLYAAWREPAKAGV
ncbi:MAG: iron-containing redox enzyme family protein [Chloroflexi bacterium]|nr:iron-containing redox enzyme family protein [Chloroflexota bacterium]